MQGSTRGYSLVQDSGPYRSSCGYCNDESGSSGQAHGMHAYRLTVYDYQELLDQGWRRSGKYLYKPDNEKTCCRQYTIRLKVADFQPSKPHKKLLRKWEQFLAGHVRVDGQHTAVNADIEASNHHSQQQQQQHQQQPRSAKRSRDSNSSSIQQPQHAAAAADQAHQQHSNPLQPQVADPSSTSQPTACTTSAVQVQLQQAVLLLQQSGQLPERNLPAVKVIIPPQQKVSKSLPAGTLLTSSSAHQLAAAVRKVKQQQQQKQQPDAAGGTQQQWIDSAAALAAAMAARYNELSDVNLRAVAVHGYVNVVSAQLSQEQQQQQDANNTLQQHKQQQDKQQQLDSNGNHEQYHHQHQQSPQQQSPQQQQRQQRHLEIRMVPSHFIQEEYELYCKYQITQHHDDPQDLTPSRYRHFLVDTPLIPVLPQQGPAAAAAAGGGVSRIPSCGYGSFHQQYWLDGQLIAVGVVDVLPRCLSSKYFFWDPDYAWLSLGRYGALREINWVAAAHAAGAADLEYYYLGYYIHNCPKMSYKAEYAPSELLCPKRQVWVKLNQTVLQALHDSPYVVLSDLPDVQIRQNLSVSRQVAAADAAQQASTAAAAQDCEGHAEQQEQQQQGSAVHQQQLNSQLVFLLKQPVRWGALRDSGLLNEDQISLWEERLMAWRRVVGETAAYLLYATPGDLLNMK